MKSPIVDLDEMPPEFWEEIGLSRAELEKILAAQAKWDETAPSVGSEAPDFHLARLAPNGVRGEETGQTERLSDYRGKPVALLFGSYT